MSVASSEVAVEYPGTDPSKCTGCLVCEMHCSFAKLGDYRFNPEKAYVRITPHLDRPNEIHFTEECDGCNICV